MNIRFQKQTMIVAIAVGLGVLLMSVSGIILSRGTHSPDITSSSGGSGSTESTGSEAPSQAGSETGSAPGSSESGTLSSGLSGSASSGSERSSSASASSSEAGGDSTLVWPKPSGKAVSSVRTVSGVPRLIINGKQVPPVMFFGNTDMNARYDTLLSEFKEAAAGNIHLHSIISSPAIGDESSPEVRYFDVQNDLDLAIEGDPDGYILLRVNVGKYWNTSSYPADQIVKYVQKRADYNPMVSIESDLWFEQAKDMLAGLVEYIRNDPVYSKHVIGYHLDCGEWFQYMFRENGVDISLANTLKFRQWLTAKYKTDTALRTAWGDPQASLAAAVVPSDLPGNLSGVPENRTLMLRTTDRRYIDYLDYIGDLVSSRINGLAKTIKDTSNSESIVIAFYGYLFELADPQSGHYNLESLLASKNLDGFASPECYLDRNYGELFPRQPSGSTGAYMTAADSVQRAGKLWFVESDQRTFINRYDAQTEHDTYLVPMQSVEEIIEVAKRDVGSNMIRGAGIWFMDLWAVGWLDDPAIWNANGKLAGLYQAYMNARKSAPSLDAAFVVDEDAMSLVAQPTDSAWHFLSYQRYDFYRAGISWGMFTLKDLLDNKIKDAKVIFLLTPFRLSAEQTAKIKSAVQGKTLVFSYGFGSTSPQDVLSLTGMKISRLDGRTNVQLKPAADAADFGLSAKATMGASVMADPRWAVDSGYDSAIGQYSDGKVGFAARDNGSFKSVFFGGMRMDTDVIRAIVNYAGTAHVYAENDDVVMADENLVVIHSSAAGVKTIRFPSKCDVYDYFDGTWYQGVTSIKANIPYGQTKYYFYGKKADIEAMKLPAWK